MGRATMQVTAVLAGFFAACSFSTRIAPVDDAAPSTDGETTSTGSEGVPGCTMGVACDDLDSCTDYDACVSGTCTGIDHLCPATCANSCTTCSSGTCCQQDCPSGVCPTCLAGCACGLSCKGSRPCTATCVSGSECYVDGTGNETDGNYMITCQAGSLCAVKCVGDEGSCTVTCEGNASCLVEDAMQAATATLVCPMGTVTTCANNIKVCNRPCP